MHMRARMRVESTTPHQQRPHLLVDGSLQDLHVAAAAAAAAAPLQLRAPCLELVDLPVLVV